MTLETYSWKYFVSIVLFVYASYLILYKSRKKLFAHTVEMRFNLYSLFNVCSEMFFQDECQMGFQEGFNDILFGSLLFNVATVIFDKQNNRVGITQK